MESSVGHMSRRWGSILGPMEFSRPWNNWIQGRSRPMSQHHQQPESQLTLPVSDHRDHIRGNPQGEVTLIEYGDFQCPHCGRAHPIITQLLERMGDDIRFVFRHFPLTQMHPDAQLAAGSAESAATQGKFWEMHDALYENQEALDPQSLSSYAA